MKMAYSPLKALLVLAFVLLFMGGVSLISSSASIFRFSQPKEANFVNHTLTHSVSTIFGSLGAKGNQRALALARQKERNIIIDATLYNWTHSLDKNWFHVWDYFWPVATCDRHDRIGKFGDGGKWVCNVQKIQPPCAIYSFGSAGDTAFENILVQYPGCHTFTFDPVSLPEAKNRLYPNMYYYPYGLGPTKESGSEEEAFKINVNGRDLPTKSLGQIYKEVGRKGAAQIDILKMDVEFTEYFAIPYFVKEDVFDEMNIKQIVVEVHGADNNSRDKLIRLIRLLEDKGFMIFSIELNYHYPNCAEIALVHESFL